MKTLKFSIFASCFSFILMDSTAQVSTNQASATFTVTHSETRPLLQYLFDKYGIETSEAICLNIQSYEAENNVKVLFDEKYDTYMQIIDNKIISAIKNDQIISLKNEKKRFVQFSDIESKVVK